MDARKGPETLLKTQHRFFRSVLIACDTAMLVVAIVLAYPLRFSFLVELAPPGDSQFGFTTHAIPVLAAVPLMLLTLLLICLYHPRRDQRFYYEAVLILKATAIGVGLTIAFLSFFSKTLFDGRDFSRIQFACYFVLSSGVLLAWRFIFRKTLRIIRSHGRTLRHVALIGSGRLGQVV